MRIPRLIGGVHRPVETRRRRHAAALPGARDRSRSFSALEAAGLKGSRRGLLKAFRSALGQPRIPILATARRVSPTGLIRNARRWIEVYSFGRDCRAG